MRIAVCLSGQIRDFDHVRATLRRRILSRLSAHQVDLYAHYPSEGNTPRLGLHFTAVTEEDETNILPPAAETYAHDIADRPWHNSKSLRAFYLQVRSIYLANELKREREQRLGFVYDWVFRLRFDNLYFGGKLEDLHDLDPGFVYIPRHDNWFGYNDRFAFGGSRLMDIYARRYQYFSDYLESGQAMHPETFLKWVLDRHGIQVRRTRIAAHLLRYRALWRARFWPSRGDASYLPETAWETLYSRLLNSRFCGLSTKLYLAKARYMAEHTMSITNVLVFPSGTGIAQEIFFALMDCKNIRLFGASSQLGDLGSYLFNAHYFLPHVTDPSFLSALIELCSRAQIDVIYPAHDDAVLALALKRESVPAQVIAPSAQSCLICRSKSNTYQCLEGLLPVPRLYLDPPAAPDAYPLFLKPDKGQGSQDAYKVATPEELASALDRIADPVITEYLPGKEYTVDCFSDRDRGLLYAQGRERVRVRSGISMNTRAASLPVFTAIAEIIHDELHMRGPWFFQVKARETGEMVLLEVGPRVAGAMALSRAMGVNLPLLGIHEARREPISIRPTLHQLAMERSYRNHYRHQFNYGAVYMDLDDTIVVHGKVNVRIIAFVYQCLNKRIPVHLITRHAGVLSDTLERYRLGHLFSDVIHLQSEEPKSLHIDLTHRPIFIDDSFRERNEIAEACGIPVFDPSTIEVLMEP